MSQATAHQQITVHGPCVVVEGYDLKTSKWRGRVFASGDNEAADDFRYSISGDRTKLWIPPGQSRLVTLSHDETQEHYFERLREWWEA